MVAVLSMLFVFDAGWFASAEPLPPQQAFVFNLNCWFWDSKCELAKTALDQVGAMIAKQLLLTTPVKVCFNVVLDGPLTANTTFSRMSQVQQAPGSVIISYPTSVTKQTTRTRVSPEGQDDCDFAINFNAYANWNFGTNQISSTATDFKLVAAQVITYGLGFVSNLQYLKGIELPIPKPSNYRPLMLAAPKPFIYRENDRVRFDFGRMTFLDSVVYGFKPPSDLMANRRGTVGIGMQPISQTWEKFQALGLYEMHQSPSFLRRVLSIFSWNWRCLKVAMQLGNVLSHHIEARLSDGTILPLKFSNGYYMIDLEQGPEYLMATNNINRVGCSLDQVMKENNAVYLYGPKALQVFEEMGYNTKTSVTTSVRRRIF